MRILVFLQKSKCFTMLFECDQTVWDIPTNLRLHYFFALETPPQNVDLYLCFPYVERSALQNGRDASSGLRGRFVLQNTYANNKTSASLTRNAWFRSLIRQWHFQKTLYCRTIHLLKLRNFYNSVFASEAFFKVEGMPRAVCMVWKSYDSYCVWQW